MLVLRFHLGRLGIGDGCGTRDIRLPEGVGVTAKLVFPGVGDVSPDGLGIDDLRPVTGCGTPENRRTLGMADRAVELPTELSRRLEPRGVELPLYPLPPLRTTDDAGELPGVSIALPVAGLSIVTMLEMESRS